MRSHVTIDCVVHCLPRNCMAPPDEIGSQTSGAAYPSPVKSRGAIPITVNCRSPNWSVAPRAPGARGELPLPECVTDHRHGRADRRDVFVFAKETPASRRDAKERESSSRSRAVRRDSPHGRRARRARSPPQRPPPARSPRCGRESRRTRDSSTCAAQTRHRPSPRRASRSRSGRARAPAAEATARRRCRTSSRSPRCRARTPAAL